MMPPKPARTKYLMKSPITSSYDVPQSTYEDLDAPMPAVTDGSQSEVKFKPVPRPRSKIQPKSHRNNNNNTADSADTTGNTTNAVSSQLSGYAADHKTPHSVRPPPRPPLSKYMTSAKPTAAVDGGNHYMTSVYEPPPPSPPTPRPERPPPPSIYYNRCSTMKLKPESDTDESQESTYSHISLMQQPAVSPDVAEEELNLGWTYNTTATDKPAVPPRLGQSTLPHFAVKCKTLPPQNRPPPPSFTPPPPPSTGTPSEPVYSDIENRPYLDVLPEDVDKMTLHYQNCSSTSRQQDTEDIKGMLRWLKRESKPDSMAPSLYGLSIEEEIRSFQQRAFNVRKALRLYNLLMMKHVDCLRKIITEFTSISENLDKMKKKGKTMDIAGGTTGAVGGVTAVLGIAFAPMTMGASLIATVVGAGMMASAGGMGAHTAMTNKKKVVNRMTVEKLVYDYKGNVVDVEHCLSFILSGMNELRRHDIARIQRAGAQTDALKTAHLSQSVFNMNNDRRAAVAHTGGMSSERLLLAFVKEIDLYFTEKDGQKLKKSIKSKLSGRVRLLAENLHHELDHMISMWEMFG
ncbi:uncharacterized protein LOC115012723 isoform X2 [Cottoperca gobio]|uniref:Uncharacterized protein LOC115012723 isoform X2 n=1 Tax=Cottoperca gobio TaxID=56716 RepID=A0A6J2QAL6_COTGO|nr:uncharacterized protein LOC115012723 isoform X2 [Cottoperca gobio]